MSFTAFSDNIDPAKTVQNSPFWPDLNLKDFAAGYRLPGEYRETMVEDRLKLAMIWANDQLRLWRQQQEAAGVTSLSDVPVGESPAWGSPLVLFYTRAVSCHAKALLLADYPTMMRKSDAINDAKESDETADKWHSFAMDALNTLQDKPKIHAESL
ncbi:MAG: head completion/stabilization protein [Desulfobacter sp.]|nr:head completion/stabilization protein [Desulfobacter sp.]